MREVDAILGEGGMIGEGLNRADYIVTALRNYFDLREMRVYASCNRNIVEISTLR